MNTESVLETLKEMRRWEQTTSTIEARLKEVQTRKTSLREELRSLELTLSALDEERLGEADSSTGRGM